MEFIAQLWWFWLVTMVVSAGFAIYRQVGRAQRLGRAAVQGIRGMADMAASKRLDLGAAVGHVENVLESAESFLFGVKMLIAALVVSALSAILFLVAIAINLVHYFR